MVQPRDLVLNVCCFFVRRPAWRRIVKHYIWQLFNLVAFHRLQREQRTCNNISGLLQKYLLTHDRAILLQKLKNDLDMESCRLVELYLQRHESSTWHYLPGELLEWRRNQRQIIPFLFPVTSPVIHDVFDYHNGLKFVPAFVKDQIATGSVIDGGAAAGDSALMFTEYHPVNIYAFEPSPLSGAEIEEAVALNNIPVGLIDLVPFGIGDKKERVSIKDQHHRSFDIETITIDEFAKNIHVSCIKLDIEGMESSAINGAKLTICRDRPVLLISIYHTPEDFFEIKPVVESWKLGYRFAIRNTEVCNGLAGVHAMLIGWCEGKNTARGGLAS